MFGKKEPENTMPKLDIKIMSMPDDFYAGSDPTVKFKKTEQTVNLDKFASPLKPHEKRALDSATAKGPGSLFTSTKFWLFSALVLFILFALGGALYYWLSLREKPAKIIEQPIIAPPVQQVPIEQPLNGDEIIEPIDEEPIEEPPKEIGFELPSKYLPVGSDMDNDGVSDASEEVFGSDPGNPDTDGDGYLDGVELYYLYNPAGIEPEKLIDSGTVRVYKNNNFGYELYHPVSWVFGNVDSMGRQVLFSALSGENIEVRVFDMPNNQTFEEWFVLNTPPDERLVDYREFESRFGTIGQKRFDDLVYFFVKDNQVFALVYHLGGNIVVNYKTVLEVMARSFIFVEKEQQYFNSVLSPEDYESAAADLFDTTAEEEGDQEIILEESGVDQLEASDEITADIVFQEEIGEQFLDFIESQNY